MYIKQNELDGRIEINFISNKKRADVKIFNKKHKAK